MNAIDSLNKSIQELLGNLQRIDAFVSGGSGGASGGQMAGSLAGFTPPSKAVLGMNLAGSAITAIGGMAAAGSSMMPDTLSVVARESQLYSAGLSMGGIIRRDTLEQQVRSGLGNRQILENATGVVSGMLTGMGVVPTSAKFREIVSGAGGAARLLNQSEDVTVRAMAGLTAGQSSAMLLQNYGIFTANPLTGAEASTNEVFNQLANRFTQGAIENMSTEELMTDIRRGALGSNIRNSGLDTEQQELFKTFLMARTQGVNLDLADASSVQAYGQRLEEQGFENPLKAFQEITAKDDELREVATSEYIAGINDAKNSLIDLKNFTRDELIPTFGRLKATIDTFTGESAGAGALGAGASLLGGLAQGAGAIASYGILSKAAGALGGGGAGPAAGKLGGLKGGLGVAGGVLGAAATAGLAANAYQTAASGGNAIGSVLGATASGALAGGSIGMLFGLPGAAVGAAIGGGLGLISSGIAAMTGNANRGEGGGSDGAGAGVMGIAGSQSEAFYLQHPTKSAKIGARYMAKYSVYDGRLVWPNGHKGIDYEGVHGDFIHAAAPGTAYVEEGGELGLRVKIQHANGKYTFYCHLSSVDVSNGQRVERGHVVGRMGSTGGKSSGVHLHFALSSTSSTAGHENPEPYLRGGASYMEPAAAEQSQSATGNTPAPVGNSVSSSALGGADASAANTVVSVSGLSGSSAAIQVGAPGSGSAQATEGGVSAWSASHWALANANSGGAPEGGEGAIDSSDYVPAKSYGRSRQSKSSGKNVTNNVTINLSVANASDEEAKKFALMIKEKLEDDKLLMQMGRR